MTLKAIADALVVANRDGQIDAMFDTLYGDDVVSAEAFAEEGQDREITGVDAIRKKHEWWQSTFEVHSATVSDPMLHGDDRFAVIFHIDATNRQSGERMQMREIAVYHVKNDKVVREEFFYPPS